MIKSILLLFFFINPQSFSAIKLSSTMKERGNFNKQISRDIDYLSKVKLPIPHVVGLTLSEAMEVMAKKKLKVGLIVADAQIKNFFISELTVYLQSPNSRKEDGAQKYIHRGEYIDLWITDNAVKIDSLKRF